MIDIASALAERYPDGTVIVTWVCDRPGCSRGWTAPKDWRRPSCSKCGGLAVERGAHIAIPLRGGS